MNSEPTPPSLAQRLLRWFCAPHRLDEMEGDLDELFKERVEEVGSAEPAQQALGTVALLAGCSEFDAAPIH